MKLELSSALYNKYCTRSIMKLENQTMASNNNMPQIYLNRSMLTSDICWKFLNVVLGKDGKH